MRDCTRVRFVHTCLCFSLIRRFKHVPLIARNDFRVQASFGHTPVTSICGIVVDSLHGTTRGLPRGTSILKHTAHCSTTRLLTGICLAHNDTIGSTHNRGTASVSDALCCTRRIVGDKTCTLRRGFSSL